MINNDEQANPFLTRIIYEEQIMENDSFGIVEDIEPIVPEHYLFYSKKWLPSISDCNIDSVIKLLEKEFTVHINKPYAYFERGRASFCTSMNGVLHGHGHLVPYFKQDMSKLFPYGKVEYYPSLHEAYGHVCKEGQYLLWGNLGEKFFIINNVEVMPKRTIRNTIRKYYND